MKKWRTAALFTALLLPFAAEQASAKTWEAKEHVALDKQWTILLNEPYQQAVKLSNYIEVRQDGKKVNVTVAPGNTSSEILVSAPEGGYEETTNYELYIDETLPSSKNNTLQEDIVMPFTTQQLAPVVDEKDRRGEFKYVSVKGAEKLVYAKKDDVIRVQLDGLAEKAAYQVFRWDDRDKLWLGVASSDMFVQSNGLHIDSARDAIYKIVIAPQPTAKEVMFTYNVRSAAEYATDKQAALHIDTTVKRGEAYAVEYVLKRGEALQLTGRSDANKSFTFEYYTGGSWHVVDSFAKTAKTYENRYLATEDGRYRLTFIGNDNIDGTTLPINVKGELVTGDEGEYDDFYNPRVITQRIGKESYTLHARKDVDYFAFSLQKGQALQLQTQKDVDVILHRKDQTGRWQEVDRVSASDENVNYSFQAPVTGDYIVTIQSTKEKPSYDVATLNYAVLDGDGGEIDSFDNPRIMTERIGNEPYTLNANKDVDYFAYTLTAGQALQLETQKDILATLYYKNEEEDWEEVTYAFSLDDRFDYSFKIDRSGEYIVTLENMRSGQYKTQQATLNYAVLDGDAGEVDSFDNPRVMTALSGSEPYTLNANEDVDYFAYTLTAGQALQLQTQKDVRATLYRQNAQKQWTEIEQATSTLDGLHHSFLIDVSGTYIVTLENVESGLYKPKEAKLTYHVLNGDAAEIDSFDNPRVMTKPSGEVPYTLHANKDVDYYQFTLKVGQKLRLVTQTDVRGTLYAKEAHTNKWVVIEERGAKASGFDETFTALADGEYIVTLENSYSWSHKPVPATLTYTINE